VRTVTLAVANMLESDGLNGDFSLERSFTINEK